MTKDVQQQEEQTTAIDLFISQELSRFDKEVISEKDLQKLVKQYSGLKVNGVEDREGLNAVRKARIDLKNKVVEIKKKGKATRDSAVKFQKAVIERENTLVNIIEPTKKELEAEEDRIAELKEQQRLEEEKKEAERIQLRLDKLNAVEAAIDFHTLSQLNDEEFEYKLHEATIVFREIERQREEQRIKEENALKAEKEHQAKLKAEQEAKEKAFAEEQRKFREEQERIAEANRKKEEELRAKEEKLAVQEAEKKRLKEIEDAKKAAAEKALKDKEEAERRAKEEEEERKKEATEKEKFEMIAKEIEAVLNNSIWNTFKSKKGKASASSIHNDLLLCHKTAKEAAK